MGVTHLQIDVGNVAKPDVTKRLKFLVDSGAVYAVVPADVLERLGIKPLDEQTFILANGDKIVRKKGGALFRFNGRVGVADVIFGEQGDAVLLGALTLESLGFALDPLKRELRELPMMLA